MERHGAALQPRLLISALEDENSNGRLQASLTTCGIVAGGLQLGNYQLDGEYAMDQLLAGGTIKLVNFAPGSAGVGEGLATGYAFDKVADAAQQSPQGRARLALAMSLMNVATWAPGETMPAPNDFAEQERQQYLVQFKPAGGASPIQTTMDFVEFGRPCATGLGDSAFIHYEPGRLSGDNGPFDPFTGGSFPFGFGRW